MVIDQQLRITMSYSYATNGEDSWIPLGVDVDLLAISASKRVSKGNHQPDGEVKSTFPNLSESSSRLSSLSHVRRPNLD
jgi:hypothetical protein